MDFFSESDKSITVNESLIKDNLSYNQAMNTFFHEYWHFNQACIQSGNDTDTNITKLNNDYYYSYRPNLGRSNYNAYKNQPIEQEAWFFGKEIENNLVSNIKNLVDENFINGSQNMTNHVLKNFARSAFNLKEKDFELEIDTTNKNRNENGKADRTINLKYKKGTRQAQTNLNQQDLDAFFGEKTAIKYFDRIEFNFNNKSYDEIYKNLNDGFKNMKQQQEQRDYFEMSLNSIIKDKGIETKTSFNSSSTSISFKNNNKEIDKLLSSLETNIKLIRPENDKETLRINLPNTLVSDLKKNKGFTPYDKMRENLEHGYLISELGKIASFTNNSLKPAEDNDFDPKYCDYGVKSRTYEIDCKNGFDFTNELKKQGFDIKYDKNDDFKAYLSIPTELNFDKILKAKNEVKNNISAKLDKEFLSTPITSNKFSNAYDNIKQEITPKPSKNNTTVPLNFNKNITR
ncbi:MAG: hypothetical protein BWY78_00606 [Alphaproteobacteria bacterium ADurb.Bin438]|nr:MAG: hypothetical protein BWY78_00606 [Alphaproteobacteria bacterium ADurb.Bin438]